MSEAQWRAAESRLCNQEEVGRQTGESAITGQWFESLRRKRKRSNQKTTGGAPSNKENNSWDLLNSGSPSKGGGGREHGGNWQAATPRSGQEKAWHDRQMTQLSGSTEKAWLVASSPPSYPCRSQCLWHIHPTFPTNKQLTCSHFPPMINYKTKSHHSLKPTTQNFPAEILFLLLECGHFYWQEEKTVATWETKHCVWGIILWISGHLSKLGVVELGIKIVWDLYWLSYSLGNRKRDKPNCCVLQKPYFPQ